MKSSSPIDVVVSGGGVEAFCGPMIRSWFSSEPVSLCCDLHKYFLHFLFFLDPSPDWLGSHKVVFLEDSLLRRTQLSELISEWLFSLPTAEA